MILCPECESNLDIEDEELEEGEIISCPECGSDFEVVNAEPLELARVSEKEEEGDEHSEEENEDGDYS